jgi:two-component system OmpR family sensor kinase
VTLRTRLLLGLVLLATAGMAVAGYLTYRQTRDDLIARVNRQLASASESPDLFFSGYQGPQSSISNGILPPGTWAQLRLASTGAILVTNPGSLGMEPPSLPSDVEQGTTFTVASPHYRVSVAEPRLFSVGPRDARQYFRAFVVVAIPLSDVDHTLHHLFIVELIVAIVVLLLMSALAWYVVQLGLRPLSQMETTAGAIAAGDLSQRIDFVDEHTEVGRLGIALNEMLQQIERAFAERAESEKRLRRFVGDASHELRTPLTSIRGYAELFRRGAADRPEDLAKTMRRIEEEAGRMGVLVDDLLLLARLDQGRPLERLPVDLTRITTDAVDDTRAIAPGRFIEYEPNGAVVVPGDEVRLRQVLGNLLQNAVRHTPADTPVHVRVAADDAEAVIEVRDEGPGMATDDAAHVFERFWRTDESRQRASGGSGLGLAIVAAIVSAHGGSAEVETAPGAGATFRVHLPRTIPAAAPPDPAEVASVPLAELEEQA